eukprot:TRINITY_DN58334_c0_g1_i1.p2 TRINITY_DN58334_c0_g1~~TRINITY_DN58334_c0_g1_i1.p2  ORF type:complete len:160 (+),score=1.16 TRINITY_DN58334_c0_g1_i1:710-1189(+)
MRGCSVAAERDPQCDTPYHGSVQHHHAVDSAGLVVGICRRGWRGGSLKAVANWQAQCCVRDGRNRTLPLPPAVPPEQLVVANRPLGIVLPPNAKASLSPLVGVCVFAGTLSPSLLRGLVSVYWAMPNSPKQRSSNNSPPPLSSRMATTDGVLSLPSPYI